MTKVSTLYKLTTADGYSRNGNVSWEAGCVRSIPKADRRTELCAPGMFHVYRSPELALLRDPRDAGYGLTARIWEVRGRVVADSPLKQGCHRLRVLREIPLPPWLGDEKVRLRVQGRFALLCWQVLKQDEKWGTTAACEEVLAALRAGDRERLNPAAAATRAAEWAAAAAAAAATWAAAAVAAWAAAAAAKAARADHGIDFDALAKRAVALEVAE